MCFIVRHNGNPNKGLFARSPAFTSAWNAVKGFLFQYMAEMDYFKKDPPKGST